MHGLQCVTYSMAMELFYPGWPTLAGCVVEGFWATGIIILALIARFVQHWHYIQLAPKWSQSSTSGSSPRAFACSSAGGGQEG